MAPCENCSDKGIIRKTRKIDINIFKGIDNGRQFFCGNGDAGRKVAHNLI